MKNNQSGNPVKDINPADFVAKDTALGGRWGNFNEDFKATAADYEKIDLKTADDAIQTAIEIRQKNGETLSRLREQAGIFFSKWHNKLNNFNECAKQRLSTELKEIWTKQKII